MATHSSILAWKIPRIEEPGRLQSMGSQRVGQDRVTEHGGSDVKESACNFGDLGWKDPMEEGMATHSSILVWRIIKTEELGGLQSVESQGDGHSCVTKYSTARPDHW